MQQEATYVGIDVAKEMLDVALRPTGERWRVAHDEQGLAQLVATLAALAPAPALVVLEATGGLELELVAALAAAALPVVVVNPRQVRDFARATGTLAKTDALDAAVLAHFAEAVRPPQRPLSDAQTQTLRQLLTRRRQLVVMRVAEGQRLTRAGAAVRPGIEAHIAWLEQQLQRAGGGAPPDAAAAVPSGVSVTQLLRSVPGVGEQLSLTLLAELPELGTAEPPRDRRPGRRGALQPRQRQAARATHDLGRTRVGARRALHGRAQRQPPQPGDPRLLPAPARGRQAQKGGPHRLHAQAAGDPQRDAQAPHPLARLEPQQRPLS